MATIGGALLYGVISGAISYAVNWIFAPDTPDVEGPRMDTSVAQTSAYGQPIKRCYGETRFAGNIIWSDGLTEHVHTEKVGGKGGSSGTQTTYTYTASFAIGLCDHEIVGIRRIWADSKLMYDGGVASDYTEYINSLDDIKTISVYTGTETQLPDAVMEAIEGSGNVPAYRGLSYVVFEDLELADYGNRIPNLEFEVLAAGTLEVLSWDFRDTTSLPIDVISTSSSVEKIPGGFALSVNSEGSGDYTYLITGAPGAVAGIVPGGLGGGVGESHIFFNPITGTLYRSNRYSIERINVADMDILEYQFGGNPYSEMYMTVSENGTIVSMRDIKFSRDGTKILGKTSSFVTYKYYIHIWDSGFLDAPDNLSTFYSGKIEVVRDAYLLVALDFEGVSFTTEGGTAVTIGSGVYTNIYPIGMLTNNDIVFYTGSSTNDYALGITDGISTTVKTAYLTDLDNFAPYCVFLDDDLRVYWVTTDADDITTYVSEPLSTTFYKAIPTDPTEPTLSSIVSDLLDNCNIGSANYDVTDLASKSVKGYLLNTHSKTHAALQPLMQMFQFDVIEQEWGLVCLLREEDTPIDVDYEEIGAMEYGSSRKTPLAITQKSEAELPLELDFKYFDYGLNYQQNVQWASRSRSVVDTVTTQELQYPLVLRKNTALRAVQKLFQTIWASRFSYRFAVSSKYIDLVPGDVVTIDGAYKMRISNISLAFPNLLIIDAASEDPAAYESLSTAEAPYIPQQTVPAVVYVTTTMLGIPALDRVHNMPGFYVTAHTVSDYKGAIIYRSLDDGATWEFVQGIPGAATGGVVTTTLADGETEVIDGNTLTVDLYASDGDLSSTTEISAFAGSNTAAVGDDGRWEIISFVDVTADGDNVFTLSNLIRGRKGTENNMDNHTDSDKFILLESSNIAFVTIPEEHIGVSLKYKIVPYGAGLSDVGAIDFTCDAENLMPYAPDHITGSRDGSGNLTIEWVRRDRSSIGWGTVDVPMSESTEAYEIDIMNGATVERTIEVSAATTTTYSAADQTTDFGSAQASIDIKIYQLSATVGRGNVAEATI